MADRLKMLGIGPGHAVGIAGATGIEWELVHHAVLALGGVAVGIDPAETESGFRAIARTATLRALFADGNNRLAQFNVPANSGMIVALWPHIGATPDFDAARAASQTRPLPPLPARVRPSDRATIVFTSGSTGVPKGIAYRHDQMLAAVRALARAYVPRVPLFGLRFVCWLPLSNLFQRMVNLVAMERGGQIFCLSEPKAILDRLPVMAPHLFVAVPRFFEKLHHGLQVRIRQQPRPVARLLEGCLAGGEEAGARGVLCRAANRLLFRSFRRLFGRRLRFLVSGSAPLAPWLLARYESLGLPVLEAYGLSENAALIAANLPGARRRGTVGKPLPCNHVEVAEDGELLVKGPCVFDGYLGQTVGPDADGFWRSGDYATIDADGYIRLTGRKSEVFKTSTGRKIAPAEIESVLQRLPEADHAVVFGAGRKFPVALLTMPNAKRLFERGETVGAARDLAAVLARLLESLSACRRPAGFVFRCDGLSVQQGELTGNLKLRRATLLEKNAAVLDRLYAELESARSPIHRQPIRLDAGTLLVAADMAECGIRPQTGTGFSPASAPRWTTQSA